MVKQKPPWDPLTTKLLELTGTSKGSFSVRARDEHEADDIRQEVALNLLAQIKKGKYRAISEHGATLLVQRCVSNEANSVVRERRRCGSSLPSGDTADSPPRDELERFCDHEIGTVIMEILAEDPELALHIRNEFGSLLKDMESVRELSESEEAQEKATLAIGAPARRYYSSPARARKAIDRAKQSLSSLRQSPDFYRSIASRLALHSDPRTRAILRSRLEDLIERHFG